MFDMPSCDDIAECIITAETVKGETEAQLIRKEETKLRQQAG
jgi:ATP-dependent protease Clp ATPase subunit